MSCEVNDFNDGQSIYDKVMYGGMGYGSICFPSNLSDYFYLLAFPPFYVFLDQKRKGFPNIQKILVCFILTCFLYFPGLIYALSTMNETMNEAAANSTSN
jgi:uncharacterized membrane protein YqaE (UPF0057 family)